MKHLCVWIDNMPVNGDRVTLQSSIFYNYSLDSYT